jgi:glycosyltransferase involved in cell wall biosynthesis
VSGRLHGVLVTFRRPDHLDSTLRRLQQQERRLDSLVVVDNDPAESARMTVERYAGSQSGIRYLPTGANLGPAGGIAAGMRHVLAHAGDDDWMVLLDDDDPPRTADRLRVLAELADGLRRRDRNVAGVGASGTRFDVSRARASRVPDDDLVGPVRTHGIGGNQLPFYSVPAVRQVGVFDESLFFGFDDLEYGLRLGASGYSLYAHGEVWRSDREHYRRIGLDTSPQKGLDEPSWRRYYSLRNLIVILRRRGHHLAALRLAGRSVAKPLVNLPRMPTRALQHLRLNARAIVDAYRGNMGMTVPPQPKA